MKIKKTDIIKFYVIILSEFIFLPFLLGWHEIKNTFSSKQPLRNKRIRSEVIGEKVLVNVHEWGGYTLERNKNIKRIATFECGLQYQLERFNQQRFDMVDITVSISEMDRYKDLQYVEKYCDRIVGVSNQGMDFSGYSNFYKSIKDQPNSYVILTNSSVNKRQSLFLKSYINYMESNKDVGILGVSYCSKKIQSLVKNNFTPHLQSFFLMTTTDVLTEIVLLNNNVFPGENITHKLLLILKGEIMMSSLAMKLGYNLAVSLENGSITKFGKNSKFDNGYNRWSLMESDVRLSLKYPNVINELNNQFK